MVYDLLRVSGSRYSSVWTFHEENPLNVFHIQSFLKGTWFSIALPWAPPHRSDNGEIDTKWHPQSRCTGGWGIWGPHSWFEDHTTDLLCEWACFGYLFRLLQRVPMVFPYVEGTHGAHYLWDIYFRLLFDNSCRVSWIYPSSTRRPWDLHHMFANQLTKIHL